MEEARNSPVSVKGKDLGRNGPETGDLPGPTAGSA